MASNYMLRYQFLDMKTTKQVSDLLLISGINMIIKRQHEQQVRDFLQDSNGSFPSVRVARYHSDEGMASRHKLCRGLMRLEECSEAEA
jgi:hypothetical protein